MTISEEWLPKGINDLEPTAWKALRHVGNSCIIAGPGAGKTEFLAQKAAFLLETKVCPPPFRILAISFKKGAAENLASRVKQRCHTDLSRRFDSYTFDAFTKGLVDRFKLALPQEWRPLDRYDIGMIDDRSYATFLQNVRDRNPQHQHAIAAIRTVEFKSHILGMNRLTDEKPTTLEQYLVNGWFKSLLKEGNPDFLLLNRLAEWVTRCTPSIKQAINQTYPIVFVDEFQDTTFAQYDFLHSLLHGTDVSITTVGDNKQRIMLWAGAKPDAFQQFTQNFSAENFNLIMNYRSSPGLVGIQHYIASSLEPDCPKAESGKEQEISEESAQIWSFTNPEDEYQHIATWIAHDIRMRNLQPKDYAILVRQKGGVFYNGMVSAFNEQGLLLRDETRRFGKLAIQDIMHDDLFVFISALIRLSVQKSSPLSWSKASGFMMLLFGEQGYLPEKQGQEGSLEYLLNNTLRPKLKESKNDEKVIENIVDAIIVFVGKDTIRGALPHYAVGEQLENFVEATKEYLKSCVQSEGSWPRFLKLMDGEEQVSLLTIHKSKGLEYDTVIFVGLDDQSWWSYSSENPEGKATFFVALSRAKQRIIFTYSKGKNGRIKVSELYDLLKDAGVTETKMDNSKEV